MWLIYCMSTKQAKKYYQGALKVFIELNDRYEQADTYHQLGSVSYKLQEYGQAWEYYQQAIDIYRRI